MQGCIYKSSKCDFQLCQVSKHSNTLPSLHDPFHFHRNQLMDVPVIIVGGGGCGLNLSIFVSDLGVEHYLFEKHSGTSILPKAHYLNQRVMEIFRQHGIAEAIKDVGCPIRNMSRIDWRTSLGGDEIWDRRIIASVPAFGGQVNTPAFDAYR
jgi:2,4-dichlorophenol 6-monooxygenase